jgi:hypothetical protein
MPLKIPAKVRFSTHYPHTFANLYLSVKQKRALQKTKQYNFQITFALYFVKKYDMKRVVFLVASAIALSGAVQAQSKGKTLIAYFSWGGNTREMAKQIQQQTVLEGLAISGNLARRSKDDVAQWLQKIGIINNKQK